jgi:competence ComEA-like helix-hairpin-helix protein
MIRMASDKTIFFLIWFLLLATLSLLSREELPILKQIQIEPVSLNQAQLEDFMQIPRLSFKTAQNILSERNKRGGFKSFEELGTVSGVGAKTLEKIKAFLKI